MRKISKILSRATAALCCGALLFGCAKEDAAPAGIRNTAAVQLSVAPTAVSETDGTPTAAESKIHSLRVYAFVGGRKAGHYFAENIGDKTHTFYMDLTFYSDGVQQVDFYVVANEKAMTLVGDFALSDATSEQQLNDLAFTNQLRGNLEEKGLPMYCMQSEKLDFTKLKSETPPAGSGHEGHTLLDYRIEFSLQRPMAKIGVFAAKPEEDENAVLRITGLTMLAEGTQRRNYLMPPSPTKLESVESGAQNIDIQPVDGDVTAILTEEQDRKNPANYTPVMAQPFYPFENPWSNGGSWDIPGAQHKGHVLKLDFTYDGGTVRTGYIYLPPVKRNEYIAVCCLIRNDGQLKVDYSIADWEDAGEYTIEFDYPTYANPLTPSSDEEPGANGKYPQPTVWHNTDPDSDEGSYTFLFRIWNPKGLRWNPVMDGATTEDFEIRVYQMENGTRVWKDYDNRTETKEDDCVVPDDVNAPVVGEERRKFYIRVRALKSGNVNEEMSLGISYDRSWNPGVGSSLLLINGLTHTLKWEGSEFAEYVVIRQVDIPTAQKNEKR